MGMSLFFSLMEIPSKYQFYIKPQADVWSVFHIVLSQLLLRCPSFPLVGKGAVMKLIVKSGRRELMILVIQNFDFDYRDSILSQNSVTIINVNGVSNLFLIQAQILVTYFLCEAIAGLIHYCALCWKKGSAVLVHIKRDDW